MTCLYFALVYSYVYALFLCYYNVIDIFTQRAYYLNEFFKRYFNDITHTSYM